MTTQNGHELPQNDVSFQHTADVVVLGAGAAGLGAAIAARDEGASVIVIDEHYDIGGHAMLSGGNVALGGGTSWQKKYGIEDSADQVYVDHTSHRMLQFRDADRTLVRAWADENVATFEFLIENGVLFHDVPPTLANGSAIPRSFKVQRYSEDLRETITAQPGSGLARNLENSARQKGVTFLLNHKLTRIIRESPTDGKVLGITARFGDEDVNIGARKGVIIATGGHTSNVEFRRMFDPRLTEEYQTAGEPWTKQTGDGEIQAMAIGASLWATGNYFTGGGPLLTKTRHIGCRWGYRNLKWLPDTPLIDQVGGVGLTVVNWQDVILVNQIGERFWNEMDDSNNFLSAALGTNGNLGKDGREANGGGPIWAIFDATATEREGWDTRPPNVDPKGWFFEANSIGELAAKITNPYQHEPMAAAALEATIAKYNSYVGDGNDAEFAKPSPQFKIERPPFYAAWATPILHDTLTGLHIDTKCRVIDRQGEMIPGLYCAGESAGGFALHGFARVLVFGRMAGRAAATVDVEARNASPTSVHA